MKLTDDIKESLALLRQTVNNSSMQYNYIVSPNDSEVDIIQCYPVYDYNNFIGLQIQIVLHDYLAVLYKDTITIVGIDGDILYNIKWSIGESELFQLSTMYDVFNNDEISFLKFYYMLITDEYLRRLKIGTK